jgi:hypothetical protein
MLLENNGRASSSKRTRHINIRYFFITDRIAAGEVKIEYCPTGEMIADYFTKPLLQGSLFKKFRDMIMNNYGDLVALKNGADRRSVLKKVQKAKGKEIVHDWKKVVHKHAHARKCQWPPQGGYQTTRLALA